MASNLKKSNVEIKSNGNGYSVYVGGVAMDFVSNVSVEYSYGELPIATITVTMPDASTKAEGPNNE